MTTTTAPAPLPVARLHEAAVVARFEAMALPEPTSGCWLWMGALSNVGYGQFRLDGKTVLAHRVAVILDGRELPPGLTVDHRCSQRRCVNPRHLDVVTQRENTLRSSGPTATHAKQDACLRGHAYTEENTIRRPKGRECRTCREERERDRPRRDRSAYNREYRTLGPQKLRRTA